MAMILTLVASQTPLTDSLAAQACALVSGKMLRWLCPGKAVDIALSGSVDQEQLLGFCGSLEIDFFVTHAESRRKKLLLADMDSTIVQGETLDELAAHAGIHEQVAAITARAMNGELDFHAALKERVALLKGLLQDALEKTLQATALNPGAQALVKTMAAHGAKCVLISGGFTFFTGAIAALAGFHHHHGNVLGVENRRLTGLVVGEILDKEVKLRELKRYVHSSGFGMGDVLTIGDGANDLPMLLAAQEGGGLGVGYYPKESVAKPLKNIVRYGDLDAVLYAQGYEATAFS